MFLAMLMLLAILMLVCFWLGASLLVRNTIGFMQSFNWHGAFDWIKEHKGGMFSFLCHVILGGICFQLGIDQGKIQAQQKRMDDEL